MFLPYIPLIRCPFLIFKDSFSKHLRYLRLLQKPLTASLEDQSLCVLGINPVVSCPRKGPGDAWKLEGREAGLTLLLTQGEAVWEEGQVVSLK